MTAVSQFLSGVQRTKDQLISPFFSEFCSHQFFPVVKARQKKKTHKKNSLTSVANTRGKKIGNNDVIPE